MGQPLSRLHSVPNTVRGHEDPINFFQAAPGSLWKEKVDDSHHDGIQSGEDDEEPPLKGLESDRGDLGDQDAENPVGSHADSIDRATHFQGA